IDVHDVEEIQTMDDDVLPIAHEIIAELELVRDEVELSKSHSTSKPLTSIPINEEKSPSKALVLLRLLQLQEMQENAK
ncbi:hypothetical protein L7F22_001424, partial [Adiantum nelumboides]|nr:hypothetical protein [Adiantum nelumboides]